MNRWISPFEGHVDGFDDGLHGWIWHRGRPNFRVTVDIFAKGVFLGQTTTGLFRQDLKALGIGDGYHGFQTQLPRDTGRVALSDISVRPAQAHYAQRADRPGILGERAWFDRLPDPITSIRDFFGPFLRHIEGLANREAESEAKAIAPGGDPAAVNRIFERLFATQGDWDKPLSRFTAHVALKFGRFPSGGWTDPRYQAFAAWLMGPYARMKWPARLPLSLSEIAYWTADIGNGNSPRNMPLRGLPQMVPPSERGGWQSRSGVYEWAVEQTRRLWMEDWLAGESAIPFLRDHGRRWGGQSFPLSRFMEEFRKRNMLLARLPARNASDRQLIYALIMLYALRAPHLLVYVPPRWLRAMVADGDPQSPFQTCLKYLFPERNGLETAAFSAHLKTMGFDLRTQSWAPIRYRGHRLGHVASATEPFQYDIQLIGPFRRTLGLAETCRRLAAILQHSDLTINFVDYDLGNASKAHETTFPLGAPAAARINILQLNLDEIPEAMAFLPDVFSRAYNIAFPFWELSALSACHRLGLDLVDEIWAASTFLEDVFRAGADKAGLTGKTVTPIGMCVNPSPAETGRSEGRDVLSRYGVRAEEFVFLTTSDALSWVQRKNVLGAVQAFLNAFPNGKPVRLVVKTHNLEHIVSGEGREVWGRIVRYSADDPRIIVINETFDEATQQALLLGADCLVSLHRAEGLGLDMMEALRWGIPVVATAYSGNMDACTPRNSWLVGYDLVPVRPDQYVYVEPGQVWAQPRLDEASGLLRRVYAEGGERQARAHAGTNDMIARFGLEPVAKSAHARLAVLLEAVGRDGQMELTSNSPPHSPAAGK